MKADEQTRITLRKVHYAAFASQETSCFEATVLFDGKPVAEVSNDGHGGADHVRPIKGDNYGTLQERLNPVNNFIATLEPWGSGDGLQTAHYPHSLETVVGDLLDNWLIDRDLTRRFRSSILYTRSDKAGLYRMTKVGNDSSLDKWLEGKKREGVSITVLNRLPRDEARRVYREQA